MLRPQDTTTRERKNLNGLWRLALDPDSEGTVEAGRQILFKIIFPLSLPTIVVAGTFAFLLGWNDVLFASIFARPDTQTAAVALQVFGATQEGGALPVDSQMVAAALMFAAPVVLLYVICQRYLVGGLAAAA
jgi:trehalose/maltose transport system permease protein